MGFRFYRRIKMGGGLGLNLGKRGISWSIRGKGGSFGSRGFSVRTGVKGLSYQQRSKKNSTNYSTYYPRQRFSREDRNYANSIIFIGIIILLFIFNIGTEYILFIISIVIISKIYKYYKKKNPKIIPSIANSNSVINSAKLENDSPNKCEVQEEIQNHKGTINNYYYDDEASKIDYQISLEFSQLITLENICIELVDLRNQIIAEKELDLNLFKRYSDEEVKFLILHDICNIFHLFDISIDNPSKERQLWYSTVFYFTNDLTSFTPNQETEIKKTIQYLVRPDFFVLSDIERVPFNALIELKKNNNKLYYLYKSHLRAYISLIATIDFKLNTQEKKLIEIINTL